MQPLNVFRYVTSETFSLKFSWLQSTGELLSWPTLDLWNFVQCCGGIILHIEKETLNLWTNRTCYVGPIFNWLLKSNPGFNWFCFTVLCDWSRILAPPSQPIRCKTKTECDLPTRVFPGFGQNSCLCCELSSIGFLWHFPSLWLVVVITLVLVLRFSIEKRCR